MEVIKEWKSYFLRDENVIWRIDGEPLHTWWFKNKDFWFSHCVFGFSRFSLSHSEEEKTTKYLNWILFIDQILRHPIHEISNIEQQNILNEFQPEIVKYAKSLLNENLEPEYIVFLLLTIRHQEDLEEKMWCLNQLKERIHYHIEVKIAVPSIYYRFLKATLRDIETFKFKHNLCIYNIQYPSYTIQDVETILDKNSPRIPDVIIRPQIYCQPWFNEVEQLELEQINISLSGGVDSMVLSWYMCEYARLKNLPCNLIHIQYNNRKECDLEVDLLKYWVDVLKKNNSNTHLWVRYVDELHRETHYRDIYEDITRDYRFNAYRKLGGTIFLGHNRDDTVENIITNITSNNHYSNLKGMTFQSCEKDCTLIRPLLDIDKERIIHIAQHYDIPYLNDSTPSWSRRGQLRDYVLPELVRFDTNIKSSLINLSDTLSFYKSYWENSMKKWIDQNVSIHSEPGWYSFKQKQRTKQIWINYCITIPMEQEVNEWGIHFWKYLFHYKKIYAKNVSYPSNKSWNNLLDGINRKLTYIVLTKQIFIACKDVYHLCITMNDE